MDGDDRLVGRVLGRRDALRLMGVAGTGLLFGFRPAMGADGRPVAVAAGVARPLRNGTAALPSCIVRPELTEGPYFLDDQPLRSDVRTEPSTGEAREGVPLVVAFAVSDVTGGRCAPLAGATVDLW